MKFDREHHIWECAATDTTRGVLTHVLIERTSDTPDQNGQLEGRMVAADGFMLAVVPCTLDADDVPGLVTTDSLKAAVKASKKARTFGDAVLHLGADWVALPDGTRFPRPTGEFLDYRRVVPSVLSEVGEASRQQALNPYRLVQIYKALGIGKEGTGYGSVPSLTFPTQPGGPILVETQDPNQLGPVAPFAVLMPMQCAPRRAFGRRACDSAA